MRRPTLAYRLGWKRHVGEKKAEQPVCGHFPPSFPRADRVGRSHTYEEMGAKCREVVFRISASLTRTEHMCVHSLGDVNCLTSETPQRQEVLLCLQLKYKDEQEDSQ